MTTERFTEICTGYYGPGWIWTMCLLVAILASIFWNAQQKHIEGQNYFFNIVCTILVFFAMLIHAISRIGAE